MGKCPVCSVDIANLIDHCKESPTCTAYGYIKSLEEQRDSLLLQVNDLRRLLGPYSTVEIALKAMEKSGHHCMATMALHAAEEERDSANRQVRELQVKLDVEKARADVCSDNAAHWQKDYEDANRQNNELRAELIHQQDLWALALPILNAVDDKAGMVPFGQLHNPLKGIERTLSEKRNDDARPCGHRLVGTSEPCVCVKDDGHDGPHYDGVLISWRRVS